MERLSGLISVDREMRSKLKKVISSSANVGDLKHIYTTIGGPSSKFDEFLAGRSQFDSDHGVDFLRLHLANPRPLCDRFLRFIVLCFLRRKKKFMQNIVTDAAMFTLHD